MSNSADLILKRLRFRSTHRGCKEMDLVLGAFAEAHLDELTPSQRAVYGDLLEESDSDIWDWLAGRASAPKHYKPLLALIPNAVLL